MSSEETEKSSNEETPDAKSSRPKVKIFLLSSGALLIVLVLSATVKLAFEGVTKFVGGEFGATEDQKPPLSATEIIAMEFAGKIETAKVNPAELAEPPPGALPLANDFESREFDDQVKPKKSEADDVEDDPKDGQKKDDQKRKLAAIDKGAAHLSLDKSASKVSKNLDKKKVMDLLAKKLDKSCAPKLPDKTKTVKAQVSLSKTGGIANIKVTPSAAEKELAKCMRQKLGDAKALKPKNKAVAQVTIQFKVK